MKSAIKLEINEPSAMDGNRSFLAGMLIAVALVTALFYGVVGEDKFLLISPMVLLGYVCLSAWMVRAAFSKHPASISPPGFYLLLLFVAYGAAISMISAIPYEAKLRMLLVGLFVGAYYVWGNSLALFRRSRAVLGWLMLFALLACFYGLVNHFKNPEQVLWAERYFVYTGRLASTYICPNHFAHLLQMLLPFSLALIFIPRAGLLLRILAAYCIAVYLPTLYFTESRAGMLGALAALGVTICLFALRRSKKLFSLLVILVPLCSILLLFGAWNTSEMFKRRMTPVVEFLSEFKEEGFANAKITDFRPLTWLDSIEMIREKPMTGFGPGSYGYTFPEYRKQFTGHRIVTGHPHNEYLEVASEYGLIGFGLLAVAWGYGLIRLLVFSLKTQNQHHAFMAMAFLGTAAGSLLHSFFDFQLHVFQNALVFSLLAGIAAGPICGRRQEALLKNGHVGFRGKLLHPAGKVAMAALAVAGLLLSLQLFSSAFIRAAAMRLAEEKNPEVAMRCYQQAVKIDPSNWRAYKGMGAICFKERYYTLDRDEKYRLARIEKEFLATGYLHNPMDASLVFDYGMATVFLGDKDAGIALLEQAARLRPFNDMYWLRLGIEQRKAERYNEAMGSFRYALSLKNSPMARKNIEWLEQRNLAKPTLKAGPVVTPKPVAIDTSESPPQRKDSLNELLNLMDAQ
jgi:O-antigen ligase